MVRDEDEGQDWRSVSTRALNPQELAEARQRTHEPGRGRGATDPVDIPKAGWRDILWRVFWAMPQDRVLTTAGGGSTLAEITVVADPTRPNGPDCPVGGPQASVRVTAGGLR